MEITRLPPFPLSFDEPDFANNTEHVIAIFNDHSELLEVLEATSNATGVLHIELPNWFCKYDDEYQIEFYVKTGTDANGKPITGNLVMMHTLTLFRPYIDIELISKTPDEIEDAKTYEAIARSIIKTSTCGFSFELKRVEATGLGADYLTVPYRVNRILEIRENGLVVYSAINPDFKNFREYYIGPDKYTISMTQPVRTIKQRGHSVVPQLPASDSYTLHNTNDSPNIIQNTHGTPAFGTGYQYEVLAEIGWPLIPNDIKIATRLLINDMRNNNLPYLNAYVDSYKSEQFTINFADGAYADTGNRIVDKILANYPRSSFNIGVL